MRLVYWFILSLVGCNFFTLAEPTSLPDLAPLNAETIYKILQKGYNHEKQLIIKKKRLFESIKAVHGESSDELYALAGVQLDDFQAFQSFVLGAFQIYEQTVNQDPYKASYDFRSPALKLTFEFQRAVKVSHQRLRSASSVSNKYSEQHEHMHENSHEEEEDVDSVKEIVKDMLKEVSENADQLEEDMQQNMILFSADNAKVETVLKLGRDNPNEDMINAIVDQDNNEYVLMRPSDTTVIIEDLQLIHDFVLILITAFVFGWVFSCIGLPGAVTLLLVTVLFFLLMAYMLGADYKEAIFVGACISLSSTAVVVKCIRLDQLDHLYGLLVMQDVILGFMLAIIPALSNTGIQVAIAVLKITVSFTIFGLVCYSILIMKNHELMLLGTVAVCMTMLIISEYLGLGMELGCFAAGVIIRSRKDMYETSLDVIEPVRDLFACLFFAAIGLHTYPSFLASEAMLLLILASGVIGFKFIAMCIILYLFKFDIHKSSTMAIALAQVSEFGFVLASRAKQLSIISREVYYLLLAVTSVTLIATPLLLKLTNHQQPPTQTHHGYHREDHSIISIVVADNEKDA
ncbi:hypothetical protein BCV72DRAFT_215413 [Rhizopus microsporus var. microsporus]|uniref:Cation/H+ exchanger transmembrane domain-containing protein n=1 Tax=Rhizopus microsporus var. microsporus TaxID=86635 RepID=A0A1X0QRK7_RHIZD|nr:hypothetical protein BCV72DRAFT_215413 [Rhizopus microsporus var. microsporus]